MLELLLAEIAFVTLDFLERRFVDQIGDSTQDDARLGAA
jgi:hypothetical protein